MTLPTDQVSMNRTIAKDVLEMMSIARTALLDYRYQMRVRGGEDAGDPPVPLSIHDVDRFDDLSAVYGVSPIAAVHVEGEPVSWNVCDLVVQASMHVLRDRLLPGFAAVAASRAEGGR